MDWQHINPANMDYEADAYLAVAPPFVYLVIDRSYSSSHWIWGCYSLRNLAYQSNLEFTSYGEAKSATEAQQAAEAKHHAYEVAMGD